MNRTGAMAALSALAFLSCGAIASEPAHQARLKAACDKGYPWRMPAAASVGMPEMDMGLKLYGPDQKMLLVCNCTSDSAGKNTGIVIESDDPSERQRLAGKKSVAGEVGSGKPRFAHDLPGGSCAVAGSSTIGLKPRDKTLETWGTFDAFEAK